MIRQVIASRQGTITRDGAGVKLRRVFGCPDVPRFDPFLLLDYFDSRHPEDYILGFPWHPHRGIETITFLLSGHIEHGDSLGNSGTINDGDCQWMTAGSGIIHQEIPKLSHHLLGIQLWANLRAADKMTQPRYREINVLSIPEIVDGSNLVRVIGGRHAGVDGPARRPDIDACFLDVSISSKLTFKVEKDPEQRVIALLAIGSACFDDFQYLIDQPGTVALYETSPSASSQIEIKAGPEGARILLISGKPIGEPVAWNGPIVMNTQEELDQAFKEYRNGNFIRDQAHSTDWLNAKVPEERVI